MKTIEHDLIQNKFKDPRSLDVFNGLLSNPKRTFMEALFEVAECAVENYDLHETLTMAKAHIDGLELKLAALSWDKPSDVLKSVFNEHNLMSRVNDMEAGIKGKYPALTIDEATHGWAMMSVQLCDALAQLTKARNTNVELATQLAAAQRGILTAHDAPFVMINNDPSFQFGATNQSIKLLAEEFVKIPSLTLDMAVDRWAANSLAVDELRLELERYKDDSRRKSFAANVNAETALELNRHKGVRYKTESDRGIKGVIGKKTKTNKVRDAVFKWCGTHRQENIYCNLFSTDIGKLLVKEEVMKSRKVETLAGFVKEWEKESNFQRR